MLPGRHGETFRTDLVIYDGPAPRQVLGQRGAGTQSRCDDGREHFTATAGRDRPAFSKRKGGLQGLGRAGRVRMKKMRY